MTTTAAAMAEATDYVALRVGDAQLTSTQLARALVSYGAWLDAQGTNVGDCVAVATEPSMEACIALLGNLLHGRVSLPIDPGLGDYERGHIIRDAAPVLLVSQQLRIEGLRRAAIERNALDEAAVLPDIPDDDRPALLLYTSGTTGAPKGVLLSQANIACNLRDLQAAWKLSKREHIVHALPLFHVHGLVLGLFGGVFFTRGLHWVPKFRPEAVLAALAGYAAGEAVLYAVPTMYTRLLDFSEASDQTAAAGGVSDVVQPLRNTRLLVSGSAALPLREHERMQRLTGRAIVERYGMTETLITCAVRADDPQPGWVGPPVASVQLALRDEHGAPVPHDGESLGEIFVRGPSVFSAYRGLPEASAAAFDDGWFCTGDVACWRSDGSVRIVGRTSTDIIKCGGFKVGAGEVEAALLAHPGIAEAAVFALPDRDLGELIAAAVVTNEHGARMVNLEGALTGHVAALLSPHKRPRRIVVLPALPRNAMGKVQKKQLIALLQT